MPATLGTGHNHHFEAASHLPTNAFNCSEVLCEAVNCNEVPHEMQLDCSEVLWHACSWNWNKRLLLESICSHLVVLSKKTSAGATWTFWHPTRCTEEQCLLYQKYSTTTRQQTAIPHHQHQMSCGTCLQQKFQSPSFHFPVSSFTRFQDQDVVCTPLFACTSLLLQGAKFLLHGQPCQKHDKEWR